MSSNDQIFVQNLNHDDVNVRLENLRKLADMVDSGELVRPETGKDVNNHIHTFYSFSPYSPAKAVWMAYNAGLTTAGIMDHDSVSGAMEFTEAGKIVGIATTVGVECRVDFSKTSLNGRRLNNPDQTSIGYVALHGIPHTGIHRIRSFFAPYCEYRNERNRKMVEGLNTRLKPFDLEVDFLREVVPLSRSHEGGSITERHILYTVSNNIIAKFGKGEALVRFLKEGLKINLLPKMEKYLLDENNEYYDYDLLGLLKSEMVGQFYIDASEECPDVKDIIALAEEVGAVSAYAYLGDVGDSVTGDKKTQKFEDEYLEELFEVLKELRFNAVTYMPSRNTIEQLKRLKSLCKTHNFFEISGEDINSPRQSFICEAMRNEEFSNLIDSTWALIAHERVAAEDARKGFFSKEVVSQYPNLYERITAYRQMIAASV